MEHAAGSQPPGKELRRSRRLRVSLPVALNYLGKIHKLHSVDVAKHGLFVAAPDPPVERHVLAVGIGLPNGPIRATAYVSRSIRKGAVTGMGLQFFALEADAKERWDSFIRAVEGLPHVNFHAPQVPVYLMRLSSLERLRNFYLKEVCGGSLALFTPVIKDVGTPVAVAVIHPFSQEEFLLEGQVTAVQRSAPKRMEVRFKAMGPDEHAAFSMFMATGKGWQASQDAAANPAVLESTSTPPKPRRMPPPLPPPDPEPVTGDQPVLLGQSLSAPPLAGGHVDVDVEVENSEPLANGPPAVSWGTLSNPAIPALQREEPEEESTSVDRPLEPQQGVIAEELEQLGQEQERRMVLLRVGCEACGRPDCSVVLGSLPGVYGLLGAVHAFWCGKCATVVGLGRLRDPAERHEALARLEQKHGHVLHSPVSLSALFEVADMAGPPLCPYCHNVAEQTPQVLVTEQVGIQLQDGESQVVPQARCPHCRLGCWSVQRLPFPSQETPPAPAAADRRSAVDEPTPIV